MNRESSLPLREAAQRAGLSLPTLRRRIRQGRVRALLRPGPFGEQWEIPESELASLQKDRGGSREGAAAMISHDHRHADDQKSRNDHRDQPRAGEEASYWRGRWEELREVLERLVRSLPSRSAPTPGEEGDGGQEPLREALRQRSQELAQARNLVDNLRREKARLEGELQALRERLRGGEGTVVDVPAAYLDPRRNRQG